MSSITTAAFWRATGARVLHTFLAALLPYVALVQVGDVTLAAAFSISGMAALASLVTSLANLPEIDTATMPLWKAIGHRVLRTAGQNVAAGIAGIALLQDVPWQAVAIGVVGATVATLLRTFLDVLPEAIAAAPAVEAVKAQTGEVVAGEASEEPTGTELDDANVLDKIIAEPVGAKVLEALMPSAKEDGK